MAEKKSRRAAPKPKRTGCMVTSRIDGDTNLDPIARERRTAEDVSMGRHYSERPARRQARVARLLQLVTYGHNSNSWKCKHKQRQACHCRHVLFSVHRVSDRVIE